jgi:hypothetical protein
MQYSRVPFCFQPFPAVATPLSLIGGVQTQIEPKPPEFHPFSILENAFFDWYQCGLSVEPEALVSAAKEWFHDESNMGVQVRNHPPQRPYKSCVELYTTHPSHEISFCTIHYGGVNDKCMFRCTSDRSTRGSLFVRSVFPYHSCSRVDVAMDFIEGPDLFLTLAEWLTDYAKNSNPKMKVEHLGDWSTGGTGRTLNIGSRKSAVYIRLYEKGHHQISLGNSGADPDWLRFEAEIKPEKLLGKMSLSKLSAQECFGSSRLLRDFVLMISGDKIQPVTVGKVRKMTDHDRSFGHLCHQYSKTLLAHLELNPDPEQFLRGILEEIEKQDQSRSQCREKLSGIRDNFVGIWDTRAAESLPEPLPVPLPSLLAPSLYCQFPELLRGLEYRPVPLASVPLLLPPQLKV